MENVRNPFTLSIVTENVVESTLWSRISVVVASSMVLLNSVINWCENNGQLVANVNKTIATFIAKRIETAEENEQIQTKIDEFAEWIKEQKRALLADLKRKQEYESKCKYQKTCTELLQKQVEILVEIKREHRDERKRKQDETELEDHILAKLKNKLNDMFVDWEKKHESKSTEDVLHDQLLRNQQEILTELKQGQQDKRMNKQNETTWKQDVLADLNERVDKVLASYKLEQDEFNRKQENAFSTLRKKQESTLEELKSGQKVEEK